MGVLQTHNFSVLQNSCKLHYNLCNMIGSKRNKSLESCLGSADLVNLFSFAAVFVCLFVCLFVSWVVVVGCCCFVYRKHLQVLYVCSFFSRLCLVFTCVGLWW